MAEVSQNQITPGMGLRNLDETKTHQIETIGEVILAAEKQLMLPVCWHHLKTKQMNCLQQLFLPLTDYNQKFQFEYLLMQGKAMA